MGKRILLLLLLVSSPAWALDSKEPLYMQVFLGELKLDDDSVNFTTDDTHLQGELDDIPYLGAAGQVILRDGLLGYGWEGGAFLSWINDDVDYAGYSSRDGTYIRVSIKNAFWSMETFMGLYADLRPIERLRLYLSGGPLILFASAAIDHDNEDEDGKVTVNGQNGSVIVIDTDSRDWDITTGWYARAGIELRLVENLWMGLNVRRMTAKVDLPDAIGTFDLEGELYLLSVTHRF